MQKLIVIDPGHGGRDYGTVGPRGNKEKDIALKIGLKLADILKSQGYSVQMTRDNDRLVSMPERIRIVNQSKATLLISIHLSDGKEGIVFYTFSNYSSEQMVLVLAEKVTKLNKWQVEIFYRNHSILRESQCPSVMVELNSIKSLSGEKMWIREDMQNIVVEALANGVTKYFYARKNGSLG